MINENLKNSINLIESILINDERFNNNKEYLYKKNIKKLLAKKKKNIDITNLFNLINNTNNKKSNLSYLSLLNSKEINKDNNKDNNTDNNENNNKEIKSNKDNIKEINKCNKDDNKEINKDNKNNCDKYLKELIIINNKLNNFQKLLNYYVN